MLAIPQTAGQDAEPISSKPTVDDFVTALQNAVFPDISSDFYPDCSRPVHEDSARHDRHSQRTVD